MQLSVLHAVRAGFLSPVRGPRGRPLRRAERLAEVSVWRGIVKAANYGSAS